MTGCQVQHGPPGHKGGKEVVMEQIRREAAAPVKEHLTQGWVRPEPREQEFVQTHLHKLNVSF